jgi:A/G-specific adenine glycosylase
MSNQQKISYFLLPWFDQFGRKDLPWQKNISPYRVWLSEIMLQQTQVATVIPYFEIFFSKFNSIELLAQSSLDEVFHLWTGLGYYARAKNLHKTAGIICSDFASFFPDDLMLLMTLPGIGRSTAGAILSIAFEKPTPILDGNVKRVLSRYYAISNLQNNKAVENTLWHLARANTPQKDCRNYTQAIMDLGATVCTRTKPNCTICPLMKNCIAYRENRTTELPMTKKRAHRLPVKQTRVLIICNDKEQVLLEKRPLTGIWGGLWSFPECPMEENVAIFCLTRFKFKVSLSHEGTKFRHTFSHFHLDIFPIYLMINHHQCRVEDDEEKGWWQQNQLPAIGLAAPIKKLLLSLQ